MDLLMIITASELKRTFIWSNRAWYNQPDRSELFNKEIQFDLDSSEGTTAGQVSMVWVDHGSAGEVPRLEAECDAWSVLLIFRDVLAKLTEVNGQPITQEEFVEILLSCGFEDATPYSR